MTVHASASVDPTAVLGTNVTVDGQCYVGPRTKIGNRTSLYSSSHLSSDVSLGHNLTIYPGVDIYSKSQIGDWTSIGPYASVGSGSKIAGGVHIGSDVVINSAVTIDAEVNIPAGAAISSGAHIKSSRDVLTMGNIGSENRTATMHRIYKGKDNHEINAGCWSGTCDALEERVNNSPWYSNPDAAMFREDYLSFIAACRVRIAQWGKS